MRNVSIQNENICGVSSTLLHSFIRKVVGDLNLTKRIEISFTDNHYLSSEGFMLCTPDKDFISIDAGAIESKLYPLSSRTDIGGGGIPYSEFIPLMPNLKFRNSRDYYLCLLAHELCHCWQFRHKQEVRNLFDLVDGVEIEYRYPEKIDLTKFIELYGIGCPETGYRNRLEIEYDADMFVKNYMRKIK